MDFRLNQQQAAFQKEVVSFIESGLPSGWQDERGSIDERKFVAFYLVQGVVHAAAALDSGRDLRRAQGLIRTQSRVDPAALRDPEIDLRTLVPGA